MKKLLKKIKHQETEKPKFIDPKFDFEKRSLNTRILWKRVSKRRHSKFELASITSRNQEVPRVTASSPLKDNLLNLDPIDIQNKMKQPIS